MDITFNSLEDLYNRVSPALRTKANEMKRNGYSYVKEEDVWNFLKEKKWKNDRGLDLSTMVNDILNIDEILIDKYIKEKLSSENRVIYFDIKE